MNSLALVVLALATTVSQAPHTAEINAAKNTIVRDIDKTLPAVRLETWLQGVVGAPTPLTWGVTDCGEQTGNPALDRGRDFPICVEVIANLAGSRRLVLSLLAGSRERGLTAGALALYSAAIIEPAPEPITWVKTLADVSKLIGQPISN